MEKKTERRISVGIDAELYRELAKIKARTGQTIRAILARAVADYARACEQNNDRESDGA